MPGDNLELPQDLCDWVEPETLIGWLHHELKEMSDLQPKDSPASDMLADPSLAVLSFAYVRGVYDHEDVAQRCHSDPLYEALSQGAVSSAELHSFRGRHRELLVKVTVQLLIKATRQKFNITSVALAPKLRRRLQDNANDRLDNARHYDRGEEA